MGLVDWILISLMSLVALVGQPLIGGSGYMVYPR